MKFLPATNSYPPLLETRSKAWWKRAQLFTVATGASQLVGSTVLANGHVTGASLWLAASGLAVGAGAFVIPWGLGRLPVGGRRARAAGRQRLALLKGLPLVSRSRYHQLMRPVKRAGDLLGQTVDPCSGVGAPRRLEYLLWLYLRLLTASHQLRSAAVEVMVVELEAEAAELRTALAEGGGSAVVRSRRAALELIEQRLHSHAANENRQEEIECDLRRIEHHCALFLSQSAQAGGMAEVSLQIDLDLSAGSTIELFSEATQLLLHESGQYYLQAT